MAPNELNWFTDFCYLFLSIILEGAPFIFFGTLISGIIDAYLPPGLIDRWLPKNKFLAVIMSALLGAIFPVCECAIVPVIRRLIKKGLPVSCAITYMLAAPIINPITVISTMNAFNTGGKSKLLEAVQAETSMALFVTSSRLLIAFILTIAVGFIVMKVRNTFILRPSLLPAEKHDDHSHEGDSHDHDHADNHSHDHGEHGHDHSHDAGKPDKLVQAMRTALRDFVETAMYFTIGVAITALFKAKVTDEMIMLFNQSEYVGVNLMMILAFVLSLCSTSDAFIAANFPVPLSAKLAFLVFGPMMDVKLTFMYLAVFQKKFVVTLAIGLFVATGALCYFWGDPPTKKRPAIPTPSPAAVQIVEQTEIAPTGSVR